MLQQPQIRLVEVFITGPNPTAAHRSSLSNPHIFAGDKAFALHVAGAEKLLGFVQQGDGPPVGGPPLRAGPGQAVRPAVLLLHVRPLLLQEVSVQQQQQQCAPGMNLIHRRTHTQTSRPFLTCTASTALGVAMTTETNRNKASDDDDEADDDFAAHA